jgi:hypothetical protein
MSRYGRRRFLRGTLGGGAVTLALPFLDCFLDTNGTALADGAPLPIRFGTWIQALGLNPGLWEPEKVGPGYDMRDQLKALAPYKDKINIFSGLRVFLDGHPPQVHNTGIQVCMGGGIPSGTDGFPSIDTLIADTIGTRTRFRSLEVSCTGVPVSYSRRSGSAINPSETSPVALYKRIFGPDFRDPNAADFTPDPKVMARRSVLSAFAEERQAVLGAVGAADRSRLDEYFTSLRALEQQLDLQLQKPATLAACAVPAKLEQEATTDAVVDDAVANHRLFIGLLAHALACDQTRVINLMLMASELRRPASPMTYHIYTHEEQIDPNIGCQPNVTYFMGRCMDAAADMLAALDGVREGDGTLLDRTLMVYITDHGYAKYHSLEHMPLITFGKAGGRVKTGIHVRAEGDTTSRVGLTVQQAFGVPLAAWGTESNQTSKTFTEVLA